MGADSPKYAETRKRKTRARGGAAGGPGAARMGGAPNVHNEVVLTDCTAGLQAEAHQLACQGGTLPPDVLLKDFNSRMPGMMPAVDMRMRASPRALDGDDDEATSRNYVYGVGLLQRAGLLLKDHIELLSLHCQAEGAAGVRAAANQCIASVLELNLRGGARAPGLP